jgi:hypothetical protein
MIRFYDFFLYILHFKCVFHFFFINLTGIVDSPIKHVNVFIWLSFGSFGEIKF